MRKYTKVSDMTQEAAEKYKAKHARAQKRYRETHEDYTDAEQVRNYERHAKDWALNPARCELVMVDGEASDQGYYNLFQAYTPSLGIKTLGDARKEQRIG